MHTGLSSRLLHTGIALALMIPALAVAQSAPAFTLEAALSAPFPSGMVAAPKGGAVAWVMDERGPRNIWVAEPPAYRGRRLTSYTADDGQEISELAWTPDGRSLFYVRGGEANRAGEVPNPTSDPAGAEQLIWRASLDGGSPVRIGSGSSPVSSPRGDIVAFVRSGQIFAASVANAGEPTQLIHARGGASSLRWSPDGSKLAFTSNRGDHAFIAVYTVATKALRFVAPTVDRDGGPVWSPDGTRIAFLRIPASSSLSLFDPVRQSQPWSIVLADVASGTARTIWRALPGMGSAFSGIVADDQLFWGQDDRLVFPWERDGWTHLYSVGLDGGAAELLTPGAFEVEHVTMTPNRHEMVFSSNQGDIDRRHLWRVSVRGGPPSAITTGKGIEWSPAVTSDGQTIAFLRSTATLAARAALRSSGGDVRDIAADAIPATFPEQKLVEPESVVYAAADGMKIHAQLFRPPDLRPGERRPAVVFIHGGSRRQMLLGWHYMNYYNFAYAMNQYMASKGYVVLSINYRSGIGYGMEFREAERYGSSGASEFNDVLGAGLYLRAREDVDPARIGIWGGSYGGYLTAHALARASDLYSAGVDIHGVHDWNVGIRTFVPSYNKLADPEKARLAFQSSPMAYLDGWRSPVLVIHGDDDRNVSFSETVALVEQLRQRGIEPEQLVFPDEIHDFLLHRHWVQLYEATADFFDRKLIVPRTERRNGSSGGSSGRP
ncbi:MAG: Dipeptidyl aminopeptidase 4 [Gemmatimonadaceae bacterium]|nr:Dipeptidyl aminopeptidase 4 [Gemmatimonadaceae bacterium]